MHYMYVLASLFSSLKLIEHICKYFFIASMTGHIENAVHLLEYLTLGAYTYIIKSI